MDGMRSIPMLRPAVTAVVAAVVLIACTLAESRDARAAAAAKPGGGTASHRAAPRSPYRSLEVRVHTRDGQTLGGMLTLPGGTGKHPAVLVLSTADTTDRDGTGGHGFYRPYRQIADTLTR